MKYLNYLLGFFYTFLLRFKGVKIYPYTRISLSSKFGGMNKINRNVTLIDSSVGLGTYINNFSFFLKTKTGGFCSIGPDVRVIVGNHPINNVCIYPPFFFFSKKQAGFTFANEQLFYEQKFADKNNQYYVIIENDVWIGSHVLILNGVTVKTGAIIAAGSVVTKDVEPYTIVAGVPAKKIKSRFSDEDIEFLLASKWWGKPVSWLKKNYKCFLNIDSFKNIDENSD